MSLFCKAFLPFVLLCVVFPCGFAQQSKLVNPVEDFQIIEGQNRFVENFQSLGGEEGKAYNLPIGIKKIVGNIPFTLAITNIKFGNQFGEVTLYMRMDIPQKSKTLMFGATNVKITNKGDLVGDIKLSLLSDVPLALGNMGNVTIKGSLDQSTGTANSLTYVMLDCNGDFIEMSINGEILLNPNTFKAVGNNDNGDKNVRSPFRTIIHDWNDLIAEVSFPRFELKGAEGFEFNISRATIDLSDTKNSTQFLPDPQYMSQYFTLPDPTLWRGIYVDTFSVILPPQFKNKKAVSERIKLQASRLLIDENGITGNIEGKNILSIENGDAGGWAFSVTDFRLALIANNIKGFGFGGEINLPISQKTQNLPYEAFISNNSYLFKAGLGKNMDFNLFGNTQLKLDPTSYLQIELVDKQFRPRLVMNGAMNLDIEGLKMEQVVFTKLAVSPVSPFLTVESMKYGGEVKLNNFPVTISDIQFKASDNTASMGFDLQVNLMTNKIAASSHLQLLSENKDGKWAFKGLSLDGLKLNNVSMAGFSLDGEIRMEKNHPQHGNYFGGNIKARFGALSDGLEVKVAAIFGQKDFRYWYVEGKAEFKAGVPIGPVTINGFVGGAYYHMTAKKQDGSLSYIPDETSSLGVKAGISYFIGNKTAFNGDALFEMNFLSGGGIKNIRFYGTAEFMTAFNMSNQLSRLGELSKNSQNTNGNMGSSYAQNLPGNMTGSDVAKSVLPAQKFTAAINGYIMMDYDFPTKTFDADFKVMVNTPGGFLRGTGQNNEAGWAKLYCSPQSWYIHVGTPNNPIGLKLGLGPLSLTTQSYFMLGDKLENPTAPPKEVLDILGINAQQADYMKYPADMNAGKGVGFGSRLSFDTGNLTFLILYARFMAGTGFDLMLRDMSNYACEGSNTPVGIDGWYANGQCYAYLQGELGIRIKLLFIKKNITIIKGSTAALLQARLPNPTWIGGQLAVRLNVLGGLIKANMKMKLSFGDDCKLVRIDGDYSPLDLPIIADLTPFDQDSDVDVFLSPQATFNMKIGESFDVQDDNGRTKLYRIILEDFYITDSKGQKVDGKIKWGQSYDVASFESKEILPPNSNMKVTVSVNFEEYVNNRWSLVSENGKPARETKTASFKTGLAPNYIPLTNIEYCYPVISQSNMYVKESAAGYVQLKKGQSYLFPANFVYNANFTTKNGQTVSSSFKYSSTNSRIDYTLPNLSNKTNYSMALVALPSSTTIATTSATTKTSTTVSDAEGESFTVDYMQQAAQKIIKDGQLEVLGYVFRSSEFNTFEQKMSSLTVTPNALYVNSDVRSLLLNSVNQYELFDQTELAGSPYTSYKPLIMAEAILDDDYYKKDIAPLVYNWYPIKGINITGRNLNLGIPPSKAYSIYSGYLSYLSSNTYNESMARLIPFVYEVPYYYYSDYYELKTKAVNSFDKGIDMSPLMPLINSYFLFIRQGNYKTQFKYILPGDKQGTTKQLNYINTLNWR